VRAYEPAATLAALATLGACATAPNPMPLPDDRVLATTETGVMRSHENVAPDSVINASPDAALAALEAAYNELGIEVKFRNNAAGQLGNKRFSKVGELGGVRLSKYVGCGFAETGSVADYYRVTMSLVSQVTPIGPASRIDTQLTAYAEDLGSSKGRLSCTTLGALEQRVHALAVKHAGGGSIGKN
jgi:hypothetical protein